LEKIEVDRLAFVRLADRAGLLRLDVARVLGVFPPDTIDEALLLNGLS
jgi:hypothetical protein